MLDCCIKAQCERHLRLTPFAAVCSNTYLLTAYKTPHGADTYWTKCRVTTNKETESRLGSVWFQLEYRRSDRFKCADFVIIHNISDGTCKSKLFVTLAEQLTKILG